MEQAKQFQNETYWNNPYEHVCEQYDYYLYHFKLKNRNCTPEELIYFCEILGLKTKQPTKKQIVDFLISKKIGLW